MTTKLHSTGSGGFEVHIAGEHIGYVVHVPVRLYGNRAVWVPRWVPQDTAGINIGTQFFAVRGDAVRAVVANNESKE